LDFHAHCNTNEPELLRAYVKNCERNETITALSGGLHYGGHDFVPNEEVVKICRQYPHNLVPLAKIDLWDTPPDPAEARRYADMGVKGFKFIYPYYPYDHESYFPLYEEIEKLGLPVLFHTGGYRPSSADMRFRRPMLKNMAPINLDCIARSFQKLRIVMAHLGTEFFRDMAVNLVKLHKNLYFDLAGSEAFLGVGADELLSYSRSNVCPGMASSEAFLGKMVLGSDSYITMPYIQSQAVNAYQQALFRCCASRELTHHILGGTVASWMGIDLPATSNVNGLTTPWDRTQIS
ncbi:MAG: amidohydrolase family protein, partial [Victivallales bacterium]|nr:amidohydrolase family protein [Victivallales bacterium]